MSDDHNNETAKMKKNILAGVSMPVGVPLILPQRKRLSQIAHEKGLKRIV